MNSYYVAYNSKNHDISEPLGIFAECCGHYTNIRSAQFKASQKIREGYKNVTVFKHNGYKPYDKLLTNHVRWNYILKNKVMTQYISKDAIKAEIEEKKKQNQIAAASRV